MFPLFSQLKTMLTRWKPKPTKPKSLGNAYIEELEKFLPRADLPPSYESSYFLWKELISSERQFIFLEDGLVKLRESTELEQFKNHSESIQKQIGNFEKPSMRVAIAMLMGVSDHTSGYLTQACVETILENALSLPQGDQVKAYSCAYFMTKDMAAFDPKNVINYSDLANRVLREFHQNSGKEPRNVRPVQRYPLVVKMFG
ncbi:MAG: hypothetical protein AB7E52_08060 [Bdellovibrionales bacterium]